MIHKEFRWITNAKDDIWLKKKKHRDLDLVFFKNKFKFAYQIE